jgi:hypothetical protein
MAANATFALNAGVWFRRGRLVMGSPDPRQSRRRQAEYPLIELSKFPKPALTVSGQRGAVEAIVDPFGAAADEAGHHIADFQQGAVFKTILRPRHIADNGENTHIEFTRNSQGEFTTDNRNPFPRFS